MNRKTILAAAAAAAFALPLAAGAATTDKTAKPTTIAANAGNDGGATAMFDAMDKDKDGFISKEEAAGSPHAADFALIDKNGDGKLSREEHYMAKEHVAARAKANGTSGTVSDSSPSSSMSTPDSSTTTKPSSGTKY